MTAGLIRSRNRCVYGWGDEERRESKRTSGGLLDGGMSGELKESTSEQELQTGTETSVEGRG